MKSTVSDTPTVTLTNRFEPEGMPEEEAGPAAYATNVHGALYAAITAMNFPEIRTHLLTDRSFSVADRIKLAADLLQDSQDADEAAEKFRTVLTMEIHDVSKMPPDEIVSYSKALIGQSRGDKTDVVLWPVRELLGLKSSDACLTLTKAVFGYPCHCGSGIKSA